MPITRKNVSRKIKRSLSMLLAACLLGSSLSVSVYAEETGKEAPSIELSNLSLLDEDRFIEYPAGQMLAWADTTQTGYEPSNMLDNNPSTNWEAAWGGSGNTVLTLELPQTEYVYGFMYSSRQDNNLGGVMTQYAAYASADGNYGAPESQGTFESKLGTEFVYFEKPVLAKYVQVQSDARAVSEMRVAYIPTRDGFYEELIAEAERISDLVPTGMDNGTWNPDTKKLFDDYVAEAKEAGAPAEEAARAEATYELFSQINAFISAQQVFTTDLQSKLKLYQSTLDTALIDESGTKPLTWSQAAVDQFQAVIDEVNASGVAVSQVAQKGLVEEAMEKLDSAYNAFLKARVKPVLTFTGKSDYDPAILLDGLYETHFSVFLNQNTVQPGDNTHYYELDYQQVIQISSIDISSWFSTDQAPTKFRVEIKGEDGQWRFTDNEKTYELTWSDSSNQNEIHTIELDEPVTGSAIRIHVDDCNKTWGNYVINEIEVNYQYIDVNPDEISVSLNRESITLQEGDSFQLEATVLPVYTANKRVHWTSDNEDLVSVSSAGQVTANVLPGDDSAQATITATTDFGGKTATCQVTVTPRTITDADKKDIQKRIDNAQKLLAAALEEDYEEGALEAFRASLASLQERLDSADRLGKLNAIEAEFAEAEEAFEEASIAPLRTVKELIGRITGEESEDRFVLEMIPKDSESGMDAYEVDWDAASGRPILRGNNAVALATAYNYYLKYYAYLDFPYTGEYDLSLPEAMPEVPEKVRIVFPYEYRHYFNENCEYKYTTINYSEEEWQRRLDWMAMNGFNMFLFDLGGDMIWRNAADELGVVYTDSPASEKEAQLARKVIKMAFDLGLEPEIRPFSGEIPFVFPNNYDDYYGDEYKASFVADLPGSLFDGMYIYTGARWMNQPSGVYISPVTADANDPLKEEMEEKFYRISDIYYQSLMETLGFNEYGRTPKFAYKDLVGEQGFVVQNPAFPADKILPALESCLLDENPDAIWIQTSWRVQSWVPQYYTPGHLMVIDLEAEHTPKWQNTDEFWGTPWLWSMLHNFGGNTGISGGLDTVASAPLDAKAESTLMKGVSISPEGGDTNPALYGLMAEMTWRSEKPDTDEWLQEYAKRRYGADNYEQAKEEIDAAWSTIHQTAYKEFVYQGPFQTLVCARPQLEGAIARVWGTNSKPYSTSDFFPVWENMIKAAEKMDTLTPQFEYDLVDVTRQVLADISGEYYKKIAELYKAGDREGTLLYADRMVQLCADMDEILKTNRSFLVGTRLEGARSRGVTEAEKDAYEKVERTFLTIWLEDTPNDSGLEDYCNRHLAGLMTDYYGMRWSCYRDALEEAFDNGYTAQQFTSIQQPKMNELINQKAVAWTNDHTPYPTEPEGDALEVSRALLEAYQPIFEELYATEVALPADKSDLKAALQEAEALDLSQYPDGENKEMFLDALQNAKTVRDDGEAEQAAVDSAASALRAAMEALDTQAVNKSTLEYVLNIANGHVEAGDVDKLVPSAQEVFNKVLASAQAIYDDPNATQEQVDTAWKTLMYAIQAMGFVPGDKTELIDLVAEAKALDLNGYEDGAEKDAFTAALKAAEDLIADPDAMELDINAAYNALSDAMQNLIPKPVAGDKTELKKVIDEAEVKNSELDRYVDDAEAKQKFADALAAAKEVYEKDGATQEEIDQARNNLLDAMTGLRLRADKDNLNKWLEDLKSMDLSQYTEESAAVVRAVIAKAEALAAQDLDEDDQDLINAMVAEMAIAKAQLVPAPTDPEDPENPNPGDGSGESSNPENSKPNGDASSQSETNSEGKEATDDVPTTGDATPIAGLSLLAVAAAGMLLLCKKQKDNR